MRLYKNTNPAAGVLDAGYVTLVHKPPLSEEPLRIVLRGNRDNYGLYLDQHDLRVLVRGLLHVEGTLTQLSISEREELDVMLKEWDAAAGLTTPQEQPQQTASEHARLQVQNAVDRALEKHRETQRLQQQTASAADYQPIDPSVTQRYNTVDWVDGNPVITSPGGEKELVLTVPYTPPPSNPARERAVRIARYIDQFDTQYTEERAKQDAEHQEQLQILRKDLGQALAVIVHDEAMSFFAGDDSADANR